MTLDLHQLAARVAEYHWLETRLFRQLGSLATQGPPQHRAQLGAFAHQHAWHASLWADRFPAIPGMRLDDVTPSPVLEAVMDELGDAGPPAGVFRVVIPRLLSAYDEHAAAVDREVDGPTARVLQLCARDLLDEWVAGERIVAASLENPDVVDIVADEVRRVERAVVAAGGLFAHV